MSEIIRDVYGQPQHFKYHIEETEAVWITSDHHFGHANIIKFCNRPYPDVDAMDAGLVDTWNHCVKPNDTVFHLGDFTLGDERMYCWYMNQLNGKVFHLGQCFHHDKRWISKPFFYTELYEEKRIEVVSPIVRLDVDLGNGKNITAMLCHYPMLSWEKAFHGSYCFHGHTHNNETLDVPRLVNVCVDVTNFAPVNLHEFLKSEGVFR